MATDSARVQLELASGQNEITAPFYQTAQRRRNQPLESEPIPEDVPAPAPTMVEVPLAAPSPPAPAPVAAAQVSHEQRGGRTPWIAFAIAIVAVGVAVWWVMAQRIPDIDPRDVIARNLKDAQTAMAEGRYTDPSERSAFHYYSTVLALDPDNHEAIAGIDAIADRHLTKARLMLAQHRIAEAGVALEKARRVRPDHKGLAALDAQWHAQLKRMLAAATRTAKPDTEAPEKPATTKIEEVVASPRLASAVVPKSQPPAPAATEVKAESAPLPNVADVPAVPATLAANEPSTSLQTMAPLPEAPLAPATAEANSVAEPVAEPKLIRMVQPQYPQEALMRGIEGWVDISLQVSAAGDVVAPRVEDTSRGRMFNNAALTAVEQWKYEPRSDGSTSERVRVRVRFQRSN
jgi:protein TonB